MNEPTIAVALVYFAVIGGVLLVPATVIAVFASRSADTTWSRFQSVVWVLALVGIGFTFLITDANPADARLYRALVAALALSTAIATWVAARRRRAGGASFGRLFLTTAVLQIAVAFVVLSSGC